MRPVDCALHRVDRAWRVERVSGGGRVDDVARPGCMSRLYCQQAEERRRDPVVLHTRQRAGEQRDGQVLHRHRGTSEVIGGFGVAAEVELRASLRPGAKDLLDDLHVCPLVGAERSGPARLALAHLRDRSQLLGLGVERRLEPLETEREVEDCSVVELRRVRSGRIGERGDHGAAAEGSASQQLGASPAAHPCERLGECLVAID